MERKEFLKSIGAGAAFAVMFPCLGGCSKDSDNGTIVTEPTGVDFTIDLNSEEASKLANPGGFVLKNLVVVAKNAAGIFVAASQICSHEGYDQVRFQADQDLFYCDVHGSKFSQNGTPTNQVTQNNLKIYSIEQTGDILRVFE
ncbi:Rieske 2Fe-2S domain-containing protein [Maribacter sp.]|uniref:QcrA and Rieske domain-containing protein n=1 Tax=Maribacter sp. TaxID=1897614 RepID=UPI0025C232FD|nr:Rieske 2Fe-2S domain-containing protein [Maribacter sp.]